MHALTLWNGYLHPQNITLDYIKTLTIPDCIKLLAWVNRYSIELNELANDTGGDTKAYYLRVKADFEKWKNSKGLE